jgi:hypothetical protein
MPMIDIYAAAGTFADTRSSRPARGNCEVNRTGARHSHVRKNTAAFMPGCRRPRSQTWTATTNSGFRC